MLNIERTMQLLRQIDLTCYLTLFHSLRKTVFIEKDVTFDKVIGKLQKYAKDLFKRGFVIADHNSHNKKQLSVLGVCTHPIRWYSTGLILLWKSLKFWRLRTSTVLTFTTWMERNYWSTPSSVCIAPDASRPKMVSCICTFRICKYQQFVRDWICLHLLP
mgnify:CR=1 FL=1